MGYRPGPCKHNFNYFCLLETRGSSPFLLSIRNTNSPSVSFRKQYIAPYAPLSVHICTFSTLALASCVMPPAGFALTGAAALRSPSLVSCGLPLAIPREAAWLRAYLAPLRGLRLSILSRLGIRIGQVQSGLFSGADRSNCPPSPTLVPSRANLASRQASGGRCLLSVWLSQPTVTGSISVIRGK